VEDVIVVFPALANTPNVAEDGEAFEAALNQASFADIVATPAVPAAPA
jgi:hypothetical protein